LGAEILHNFNSVTKMHLKRLPLNYIPMKFKEVLTDKRWDGLLLSTTDYLCPLFNLSFRRYVSLCMVNKWLV